MANYNCPTCLTFWTNSFTSIRTNPKVASASICPDCRDFDWPKYTKDAALAKKSLGR